MYHLPPEKIEKAAANPKDSRVILTGVHYDAQENVWVATDGVIMAVAPAPALEEDTGTPPPTTIPSEAIKDARRIGKYAEKMLTPTPDGALTYATKTGTATTNPLEGTYPKWEMVVKDNAHEIGDEGTITIGLNARLLHQLVQAIKDDEDTVALTLQPDEPSKCITVRPLLCARYGDWSVNSKVYGLIMPVHIAAEGQAQK